MISGGLLETQSLVLTRSQAEGLGSQHGPLRRQPRKSFCALGLIQGVGGGDALGCAV